MELMEHYKTQLHEMTREQAEAARLFKLVEEEQRKMQLRLTDLEIAKRNHTDLIQRTHEFLGELDETKHNGRLQRLLRESRQILEQEDTNSA